jgi:hypothetical protein
MAAPSSQVLPTSILHAMPIIHDEKAVMVPAIDETRGLLAAAARVWLHAG